MNFTNDFEALLVESMWPLLENSKSSLCWEMTSSSLGGGPTSMRCRVIKAGVLCTVYEAKVLKTALKVLYM